MNNLNMVNSHQSNKHYRHDQNHIVPLSNPFSFSSESWIEISSHIHSFLIQNSREVTVFQSIAPVLISLSSLGVGLGVRVRYREGSVGFVSIVVVELSPWYMEIETGEYTSSLPDVVLAFT